MSTKIAIIGAGEFGKQIIDLILDSDGGLVPVCFFDDTKQIGELILGIPVMGNLEDVYACYKKRLFDKLIIAIGYNHLIFREEVYERYKGVIPFAKLIHRSSIVNKNAKIGDGSIVYPGCIIDRNACVKENVLLNLGVTISHDSVIGSHSFLAPRVVVSGFVEIGKCNFIGSGAIFIDNVKTKNNIIVGAGSVVVNDLNRNGKYFGNPAILRGIKDE